MAKEKTKSTRKSSIAVKVFVPFTMMFVLYLVTVLSDFGALGVIRENTNTISGTYLQIAAAENNVGVAQERTRTYVYLGYFRMAREDSSGYYDSLDSSISELESTVETIRELAGGAGEDVKAAADSFAAEVKNYTDYCRSILDDLRAIKATDVKVKLDGYEDCYAKVNESKQNFETAIQNAAIDKANHNETRIQGARVWDMGLFFTYTILGIIVSILIARSVVSPAKRTSVKVQEIISEIDRNEGDLTKRIEIHQNDEIGQIATSVNDLIQRLQEIMAKLKSHSEKLMHVADTVTNEVSVSNENASSVSAAMEEMAASMEEISATLSQIASGSDNMAKEINQMNSHVRDGVHLVRDIKNRATEMHQNTMESKEQTASNVKEIRKALNLALESSRNVEKIKDLTQDIMSITSQTNLLSLNASIEAARAGEAGRGFAVVADEIRSLADSSAEAAGNIQSISSQVTAAVENLAKNAESILRFIDEKIMKDYDDFVEVVNQYEEDAESVNDIFTEFAQNTEEMSNTIQTMNTGISDISIAVDESARGVTSVADNAVNLVEAFDSIQEETKSSQDISIMLAEEVERFKKV